MTQNSQFCPIRKNDLEQPISHDSQLFQSFPTEVAQNDSEWPISPDSQESQEFFSIAFMFSTTYLRLEGKVPAPPEMKNLDFMSR